MRSRHLLPLILACGALCLSACDGRTPKPGFTKESAAPPSASQQTDAPKTDTMDVASADCCCCACAAKACDATEAADKSPQKAAVASVHRAAAQPARQPVRRHNVGHRIQTGDRSHDGGGAYQRYRGPDIETHGQAYQGRQAYEHQRYEHGGYAQGGVHQQYGYAQPAVVGGGGAYAYSEHESYAEQRRYSEHSSGYAYGGHAAGYGGVAPCCASGPQPAAGRDAGGYLTWPGKSAPAPYY